MFTLNVTASLTHVTSQSADQIYTTRPDVQCNATNVTTVIFLRDQYTPEIDSRQPATFNPALRMVVGSMAAPLRATVALNRMLLHFPGQHVNHPACGGLELTVAGMYAIGQHVDMEATLYHVDHMMHAQLNTMVTKQRLHQFSPDAGHSHVAYTQHAEYALMQGPMNELAVARDTKASQSAIPPARQQPSAPR